MAISANYPTPVVVNGYACKNCTDVDYAEKHIDPAHPKDGPYGVNAQAPAGGESRPAAVTFGGRLADLTGSDLARPAPARAARLDVSV